MNEKNRELLKSAEETSDEKQKTKKPKKNYYFCTY